MLDYIALQVPVNFKLLPFHQFHHRILRNWWSANLFQNGWNSAPARCEISPWIHLLHVPESPENTKHLHSLSFSLVHSVYRFRCCAGGCLCVWVCVYAAVVVASLNVWRANISWVSYWSTFYVNQHCWCFTCLEYLMRKMQIASSVNNISYSCIAAETETCG